MFSNKKSTASLSSVDPSKKLLTDSSSLVDLKAEVFRKYQEAQFNKLHGKNQPSASSSSGSNKDAIWSKKNTGLQNRQQKDEQHWEDSQVNEAKVKESLTRKAELYDRLKEGSAQADDRFLVRFGQTKDSSDEDDYERSYPAERPEEEWVEYTDALGRTRTCMKKDLGNLKRQDKDLAQFQKREGTQESFVIDTTPDLLSEDMRREILRQKWEKEEEENLKKRNLHYNDVLFDEARTHGAGFYRFSKDEVSRSAEQEELEQLHKETTKAREQTVKANVKRKSAMEARLKKVRDRKRLKMGLPILENEEEAPKVEEDEVESEEEKEKTLEESVMEGLKSLRENAEKEREIKRKATVREWDVGKEGVPQATAVSYGEKKILSQQEWVTEKRQVRSQEFAPPTIYEPGQKSKRPPQMPSDSPGPARPGPSVASFKPSPSGPPRPLFDVLVPPPPNYSLSSRYGSRGVLPRPNYLGPAPWFTGPPEPRFFGPPPNFYASSGPNRFCPPPRLPFAAEYPNTNVFIPPPGSSPEMNSSKANAMKELDDGTSVIGPMPKPSDHVPTSCDTEDFSQVSIEERLKMFRASTAPIVNELLEAPDESDEDEDDEETVRKRAEFAPPCSMDYFSNVKKKQSDHKSGFRSHEAMADAFNFGLSQKKKENIGSDDSD